jgi:lipoprotein-anchoring transpeptidase ErfK/SrfK
MLSPPTSTTLPTGVSLVAKVTGPRVAVYETPGAPAPIKTLDNPWLLNGAPDRPVPQVFLVEEQRQDGWIRVFLAERPNGSTGWVRQSDVTIIQNPYHVEVNLGLHEIKVLQGTSEIYKGQVAIGAPPTPTPTGKSYIRVLLETPDPTTAYGPYAYGLSGYSDVLNTFNGGDGEIGLHGNNDASVLGKSVTAGCIRMDNEQISKLAKVLPLGTPVEITS